MKHKLSLSVLTIAMLLGMLAAPALAQDVGELPEGFDEPEQCAIAVAFVVADQDPDTYAAWLEDFLTEGEAGIITIDEGQEAGFVAAVETYLDGIGLTFAEACSIYGAEVGGISESFGLLGPDWVCEDQIIPYLSFSTNLEAGSIDLTWVEVTDADDPDADFQGEDEAGNEVHGIVRHVAEDVTLEPDGGQLAGKVLWPGMELDADGEPVDWPGWEPELDAQGTIVGWNEVDDGFEWARAHTLGELGVFASLDAETDLYYVTYPPADIDCSDPIPIEVAPQVLSAGLANTGVDTLLLVIGGVSLLGIGALALRRTRPTVGRN